MHNTEPILHLLLAKSRSEIRLEGILVFAATMALGIVLYVAIPRHRMKVSVGMFIVGMLLLIPLMLVAWDVLKVPRPVDGKPHWTEFLIETLTIGGFGLAFAGFSLGAIVRRMDKNSDDKSE